MNYLDDDYAYIRARLGSEIPGFMWGTVVGVYPLAVEFAGVEPVVLTIPPGEDLVGAVDVGDRVWCIAHGDRLTVVGRLGGPRAAGAFAGRPAPEGVADTINAMTPEERATLIALLAGGG